MYCTAQAIRKICLKATHFPHRAGYCLSNTAHTERDAGNQAACSCWLCTQLNCKTTWLSPRQLPSGTHRSGLLAAFGMWREWHNNNENKTIKEKNQRFNKFRKKISNPLLYPQPNEIAKEQEATTNLILPKMSSKQNKDMESCHRRVLNQHWNTGKRINLQSLQWNEKLLNHLRLVLANSYFKATEEQWTRRHYWYAFVIVRVPRGVTRHILKQQEDIYTKTTYKW